MRDSQTLFCACLCECLGQSGGLATEEKVDLLIAVAVVELSVVACAVGFYQVDLCISLGFSYLDEFFKFYCLNTVALDTNFSG